MVLMRLDESLSIPIEDLDQWMQVNLPHQQLSPPGSAIGVLAKMFGCSERDFRTALHYCLLNANGCLQEVHDT